MFFPFFYFSFNYYSLHFSLKKFKTNEYVSIFNRKKRGVFLHQFQFNPPLHAASTHKANPRLDNVQTVLHTHTQMYKQTNEHIHTYIA